MRIGIMLVNSLDKSVGNTDMNPRSSAPLTKLALGLDCLLHKARVGILTHSLPKPIGSPAGTIMS